MNLQISETELHTLQMVRDQLNMIAGLLCLKDAELGCIDTSGLYAFVDQRAREIKGVVEVIEDRQDSIAAQDAMHAGNWAHALRIARGDIQHTPTGAEADIAHKLARAAEVDAAFLPVLDEWIECCQLNAKRGAIHALPTAKPKASRTTRAAAPGTPTRQRKAA